jgi:hypothetical protein
MEQVIEWLVANWLKIAVPLLAFLAEAKIQKSIQR